MKKYLTVGDLREFLNDCNISDDTKIYIASDDNMQVRSIFDIYIVDVYSEQRVYNELYLEPVETGKE